MHMDEYASADFPGAVGSTDATHIMLKKVNYRFCQAHMGFKMAHTARTYNLTVNHRRCILATTQGHPARWKDNTLSLFDHFMQQLSHGAILDDVQFELYDRNENGMIVKRTYQGAWLLVDNGYLSHSTTVPPFKSTIRRSEIRFSAWLESMRKDVECTFRVLKGRWRILKTAGIRLFGVKAADEIFLTCCACTTGCWRPMDLISSGKIEFLLTGKVVTATRRTALQLVLLVDILMHFYVFDTQHMYAITICWELVQIMMQC